MTQLSQFFGSTKRLTHKEIKDAHFGCRFDTVSKQAWAELSVLSSSRAHAHDSHALHMMYHKPSGWATMSLFNSGLIFYLSQRICHFSHVKFQVSCHRVDSWIADAAICLAWTESAPGSSLVPCSCPSSASSYFRDYMTGMRETSEVLAKKRLQTSSALWNAPLSAKFHYTSYCRL